MLVDGEGIAVLPAFPTENVVDPTGAGDSFAGGLLGYLGTQPQVTPAAVRRGNFNGVQFHPERSGEAGARFLQSWLAQ